MKLRLTAIALILALCSAFVALPAGTTHAASAPSATAAAAPVTQQIAGTTAGGLPVAGTFTLQSFKVINGVLNAVGTISSVTVNGIAVPGTQQVQIPVNLPGTAAGSTACQILNLTLGPLDLNLLGLMVHLNQVVLNITAQPGPGNLLGNLLCAVANLLNNGGPVNGLAGLLNNLLRNL